MGSKGRERSVGRINGSILSARHLHPACSEFPFAWQLLSLVLSAGTLERAGGAPRRRASDHAPKAAARCSPAISSCASASSRIRRFSRREIFRASSSRKFPASNTRPSRPTPVARHTTAPEPQTTRTPRAAAATLKRAPWLAGDHPRWRLHPKLHLAVRRHVHGEARRARDQAAPREAAFDDDPALADDQFVQGKFRLRFQHHGDTRDERQDQPSTRPDFHPGTGRRGFGRPPTNGVGRGPAASARRLH